MRHTVVVRKEMKKEGFVFDKRVVMLLLAVVLELCDAITHLADLCSHANIGPLPAVHVPCAKP